MYYIVLSFYLPDQEIDPLDQDMFLAQDQDQGQYGNLLVRLELFDQELYKDQLTDLDFANGLHLLIISFPIFN
jgi:hypothetical protein